MFIVASPILGEDDHLEEVVKSVSIRGLGASGGQRRRQEVTYFCGTWVVRIVNHLSTGKDEPRETVVGNWIIEVVIPGTWWSRRKQDTR